MTKLAATTSIGAHDDWRRDFIRTEDDLLEKLGAADSIRNESLSHVYQRDYPLSLAEMKNLFEICGFGVATEDYAKSDHPLKDYFASFAASPST